MPGTAAAAGKIANPNLAGTTVTMDDNYTVIANFVINQYTVTASADVNGFVVPSGTITKNYDANQIFTATPLTGYAVNKWFVDGGTPLNEIKNGIRLGTRPPPHQRIIINI